ncbi:hypothetical protein [Paenibacillus lutrae]|uniref:Uncharacterized protein n=1 Tax=Paenibacillus lutrae TaxID=2078573 RepID=A0A7X3FKZ1_9BACL|nr:hypothetical protein [Paenibacillus lutrae]MVP01666.1 hypothetical protein [Paenibacillus lutrae]
MKQTHRKFGDGCRIQSISVMSRTPNLLLGGLTGRIGGSGRLIIWLNKVPAIVMWGSAFYILSGI